jgi:hypothetical protein
MNPKIYREGSSPLRMFFTLGTSAPDLLATSTLNFNYLDPQAPGGVRCVLRE